MENQAARRCTAEILEEHNIAAAMSRDIREQLEAWNAAAEAAGQAPMGQAEAAPSARTAAPPGGGGRPPVVATPVTVNPR